MCIGDTRDIWACELGMGVIDSTTILTEADRDSIILLRMITLAWEYYTFSCDRHLVDESFIAESINDTVERREVHTVVSFANELFLEIREGDASEFPELFDEALAREGNTRNRHIRLVKKYGVYRSINQKSIYLIGQSLYENRL